MQLENGIIIPAPGFGTCKLGNRTETMDKIILAAQCGYRHFDTASAYGNEVDVGKALRIICGGICKREEMFIAGKLSNDDLFHVEDGYYATFNAFNRTLERLQLDYIDLYLIHWPVPRDAEPYWRELNISTWDAMEELYHSGRIRAIGVSNFDKRHIDNIMLHSNIKPMVNQIEIQPAYQQRPLIDYCKKNGICVEAWGPLKQGEVFQIEELKEMSSRYGKTVSQLCLRFCIQLNTLPIVKCSNRERMIENMDVFNWGITKEDMDIVYALDREDGRFKNYAYTRRDQC